jgi:hypothetical protein
LPLLPLPFEVVAGFSPLLYFTSVFFFYCLFSWRDARDTQRIRRTRTASRSQRSSAKSTTTRRAPLLLRRFDSASLLRSGEPFFPFAAHAPWQIYYNIPPSKEQTNRLQVDKRTTVGQLRATLSQAFFSYIAEFSFCFFFCIFFFFK